MATHPTFKLGRNQPTPGKPAIKVESILTDQARQVVIGNTTDDFTGATFGLYTNDKFGICGPTSVCNSVRAETKLFLGSQFTPTQKACDTLYRQSGNPNFNPANPNTEDNGVEMQTMCEALLEHGLEGLGKPVAFAKLETITDANLEAVTAVFGGGLWGANLLEAQQSQTEATPPLWDYKNSGEWGGHAIYFGKNEPGHGGEVAEVISWAIDVETTDAFRSHQLEEVWVVIWPWHLEHPDVIKGLNVEALAAEYKALTGKELHVPPAPTPVPVPPTPTPVPVPPTPTPTPEPVPVPPAPVPAPVPVPVEPPEEDLDEQLWEYLETWAYAKHVGLNRKAAKAVQAWAKEKGYI